jgi:hypothetical protein
MTTIVSIDEESSSLSVGGSGAVVCAGDEELL